MGSPRISSYTAGDECDVAAALNAAYATLRELPRLDVEGEEYPDLRPEDLARELDRGESWADGTFLARVDGRPVAAVLTAAHREAQRCRIRRLGTHPAHVRRGYGAGLLRAVEDAARRAGMRRLEAAHPVDSRSASATRLLESYGFVRPNPEQQNVTMVLDLNAYGPTVPVLPAGYAIRAFRPGEEAQWVALKNRVFGEGATVEWFWERFRGRPNFDPASWFVAERDGELVGMAGVITWYDDEALARPRGAVLEWVGVVEEARGQGLGAALVRACLNYARPRRPEPLILITQPFRTAAVALYRKLGFEVAREHRAYTKDL